MKLSLPKAELKNLAIVFLFSIVALKLIFYKESTINLVKLVFGLFWVLIFPGYALMLFWKELSFGLRLLLGVGVSSALIGSFSYYLGIFGLNLKFHIYLLPSILIIVGGYLYFKNEQGRI